MLTATTRNRSCRLLETIHGGATAQKWNIGSSRKGRKLLRPGLLVADVETTPGLASAMAQNVESKDHKEQDRGRTTRMERKNICHTRTIDPGRCHSQM